MRMTLTLEPDVAAEIERLRREQKRSLKSIINELLRLGARELHRSGDVPDVRGDLVPDAHLAALAMRWHNPLAARA